MVYGYELTFIFVFVTTFGIITTLLFSADQLTNITSWDIIDKNLKDRCVKFLLLALVKDDDLRLLKFIILRFSAKLKSYLAIHPS